MFFIVYFFIRGSPLLAPPHHFLRQTLRLAARLGVGAQHGIRQRGHKAQALVLDRRVETADSPWYKYEIGWLTQTCLNL